MFEVTRKNKMKTALIVFGVFLFLSVVLWLILFLFNFGVFAVPAAVLIAVITSFTSYYNSDKVVLNISGAKPADPQTEKRLHDVMEGVCIAAGMQKPRIFVMEDPTPNAFAAGRSPKTAVVCVTTGLLDTLDYYELEGVLAHELSHIKNYDVLLSTVVTVMIGIVIIAVDFCMPGRGSFHRSSSSSKSGGASGMVIVVVGLVFIILAPIAAQLLKAALSQNREFLADATAVELTRNPAGLADALSKLDNQSESVMKANRATAGMYIVDPLKAQTTQKTSKLFSSHPPIQKRIEALENIH